MITLSKHGLPKEVKPHLPIAILAKPIQIHVDGTNQLISI